MRGLAFFSLSPSLSFSLVPFLCVGLHRTYPLRLFPFSLLLPFHPPCPPGSLLSITSLVPHPSSLASVFRSNRYPFPPSCCIRKHLVAVDLERANPPAAKQPIISFHRYSRAGRYTVKRGNVLEADDAIAASGENCSVNFLRFYLPRIRL